MNANIKTAKVTTSAQFATLLEELAKKPQMAKGVPLFGNSRQHWENNWQEIAMKINALGPPTRNASEWKKVWSDLKTRTKRKLATNAKEMRQTGGGRPNISILTPMEEECEKILSLGVHIGPPGTFQGFTPNRVRDSVHCHEQVQPLVHSDLRPNEPNIHSTSTTNEPNIHSTSTRSLECFADENTEILQELVDDPVLPFTAPRPKRSKPDDEYLLNLREQMKTQKEIAATIDRVAVSMEGVANGIGKLSNTLEKLCDGLHMIATGEQRVEAAQVLLSMLRNGSSV